MSGFGDLHQLLIVLQDMMVPLTELRNAIEMVDRELELYPIWLCPFKLFAQVIHITVLV